MIYFLQRLIWAALSKLHYYFAGTYTHRILVSAWDLFTQLWYFVVAGIVLAALISVFWDKSKIASYFERTGRLSIVMSALLALVCPLGTYVLIPLIAGLLVVGVPVAPLVAFLVASPLMNPILFSLTAGAFGYQMAIARAVSALILGIFAGLVTEKLISLKFLNQFNLCVSHSGFNRQNTLQSGRDVKERPSTGRFFSELLGLTRFVGKYFTLAILVAAAVKVLVPASWVIRTLGSGRSFSVLVAVAAGVPLYACGGGTIPIIKVLQDMGMGQGAILGFFISGPATKISTLVALKAAFRKEMFLLYLGTTLMGALIFGYLYAYL